MGRPSASASITVEAAMIMPLFIFFFLNILGAFNILRLNCDVQAAIHQAGNKVMIQAFDAKSALGSDDSSGAGEAFIGTSFVAGKVKKYLGNDYLKNSRINGGISFAQSKILLNNDYIDIVATYKVSPYIKFPGFKEFNVQNRYYGHAFTGYDIEHGLHTSEIEEEIVYITENGTVYHRDINCSYLKPSIKSVSKSEVSKKRNKDGSKYYKCEYCGKKAAKGELYITDYGNRYHTKRDCPGLKRSIFPVRISEVGGRGPCSKCG
ncbi:MAG: pilus assembly protein [Butyrivibrio sp.]|nr:pilus assembly protein [Butyrivibrio sp.]